MTDQASIWARPAVAQMRAETKPNLAQSDSLLGKPPLAFPAAFRYGAAFCAYLDCSDSFIKESRAAYPGK